MSKARAKKLRKRARKAAVEESLGNAVGGSAGVAAEEVPWYCTVGESRLQTIEALRLELLGPFLFGQNTLCDKAIERYREQAMLNVGETFLPAFFERNRWDPVRLMMNMVQTFIKLCVSDVQFCTDMMQTSPSSTLDMMQTSPSSTLDNVDDPLVKMVQLYNDSFGDVSSQQLKLVFSALRFQVSDFAARAQQASVGQEFAQTLADKEKLITPIKERGNSSFKQSRYRAATGDYNMAIKLCPYSPVLYFDRASCYLHSEEYWYACLDSYRAVVLKPGWEDAYYRCAEACIKLGEPAMALSINEEGVKECSKQSDLSHQTVDLQTGKQVKSNGASSKNETKTLEVKGQSESKMDVSERVRVKAPRNIKEKKTPFVNFETLEYPKIGGHLTCKTLRDLCNKVKLQYCSPASYFTHDHVWESLEPSPHTPPKFSTDMSSITEPMDAVFDEVWCPLLVDAAEREGVKVQQLCYLSEGTVLRSALRRKGGI